VQWKLQQIKSRRNTDYGREARGKNWTIGGQIAAAAMALALAYQDNYDAFKIILTVMSAFGSVPISPVKLSTYEHAAPIVEAKKEAEIIKEKRREGETYNATE